MRTLSVTVALVVALLRAGAASAQPADAASSDLGCDRVEVPKMEAMPDADAAGPPASRVGEGQ